MLIIFAAVIAIIFFMFGQTIYIVLKSSLQSKLSGNSFVGNIWFILLSIINIIIIIFIYVFYYYKTNEKGMQGLKGPDGFPGYQGETCYIKNNCINDV
jgi:hypothetical protein